LCIKIMNELLSIGIEVMLLGMGIVYSFLAMLVVAIKVMSRVVLKYFPDMPSHQHPAMIAKNEDPGLMAAITAAVHQYRNKHQRFD
jgi:oxaloacetate decarboxylase gamma subunit